MGVPVGFGSASRAAQQRVFLIQAVMPNHVWFSPCRADLLAPWENAGQMHILVHVAGYLAYVVPVPTVLVCLVVFGFWFWILAFGLLASAFDICHFCSPSASAPRRIFDPPDACIFVRYATRLL